MIVSTLNIVSVDVLIFIFVCNYTFLVVYELRLSVQVRVYTIITSDK